MSVDMTRFIRHTSVYAVGNMTQRAAGFILLPVYTSQLDTYQYGILELFYSVSAVLTSVLGLGLSHATLRFYFEYDDSEKQKNVVSTTLITTLVLTLPPLLCVGLYNETIANQFLDGKYSNCIIIVLLTLLLELLRQIGFSYFRAKEYSTKYVITSVIALTIQLSVNIYTVLILKLGIEGVLIGNLISVFISCIYTLYIAIKECGVCFNVSIFKDVFKYSYPFLINSFTSATVKNSDRFIIGYFLSIEALGVYALAVKFGQILKILLLESFQLGFGSFRFSIMKQPNAAETLSKIATYYSFATISVALLISLFCKELIMLMANDTFWSAHKIIPLVMLSISFGSLSYIFQTGILYTKKTAKIIKITAMHGISMLTLYLLLIPSIGTVGAPISSAIAAFVLTYATYCISQKLFYIKFDLKKITGIFSIAIVSYLLGIIPVSDNLVTSLSYKTCCYMLFTFIIFRFNLLYGGEFEYIKNTIKNSAITNKSISTSDGNL